MVLTLLGSPCHTYVFVCFLQNNKELQQNLTEMTRLVGELQGRIRELVMDSPECKMAEMEAMREQIATDNAQHDELKKVGPHSSLVLSGAEETVVRRCANLGDFVYW